MAENIGTLMAVDAVSRIVAVPLEGTLFLSKLGFCLSNSSPSKTLLVLTIYSTITPWSSFADYLNRVFFLTLSLASLHLA